MADTNPPRLSDEELAQAADSLSNDYRVAGDHSAESLLQAIAQRIRELSASNHAALTLLFTHTRVCPFGGGKNGERTCCAFGSPGCACDDFVADLAERVEMSSHD